MRVYSCSGPGGGGFPRACSSRGDDRAAVAVGPRRRLNGGRLARAAGRQRAQLQGRRSGHRRDRRRSRSGRARDRWRRRRLRGIGSQSARLLPRGENAAIARREGGRGGRARRSRSISPPSQRQRAPQSTMTTARPTTPPRSTTTASPRRRWTVKRWCCRLAASPPR